MTYYQILKKRRLDLNLSVQDIAIQTHLTPEFIRAIEDNNLDLFAEDLSYVRYFVRAYAEALGVNWQVIAAEVDGTVEVYARARDQAITQAQMMMAYQMQQQAARAQNQKRGKNKRKKRQNRTSKKSASKSKTAKQTAAGSTARHSTAQSNSSGSAKKTAKKKKPKKKRGTGFFRASAARISRMLDWQGKDKLTKAVIILAIVGLAGMAGLNYVMDTASAREQLQRQAQREQELKDKEEETQKLASQLQSQRQQDAAASGQLPVITKNVDKDAQKNSFYVTNVLDVTNEISLGMTCTTPVKMFVSVDGTQAFVQEVERQFSRTLKFSGPAKVSVKLENYTSSDELTISGEKVPIDTTALSGGSGTINLDVVSGVPKMTTKEEYEKEKNAQEAAEKEQSQQTIVGYDMYGNPIYSEQPINPVTGLPADQESQAALSEIDPVTGLPAENAADPYGLQSDPSLSPEANPYGQQADPYAADDTQIQSQNDTGMDAGAYTGDAYNEGY